MIIVEGPDGSGKTTLLKELSADLRVPVEPRIVSKDTEAMGDLRQWVNDDLNSWPRVALYDRHRLISEPIYGPLLRSAPNPGFENHQWLTNKLDKFRRASPTMIFCLPPLKHVMDNVYNDPDNKVVMESIAQIYWLYQMEAARWPAAYIWDYTREDNKRYYRGLLAELRRREGRISEGRRS